LVSQILSISTFRNEWQKLPFLSPNQRCQSPDLAQVKSPTALNHSLPITGLQVAAHLTPAVPQIHPQLLQQSLVRRVRRKIIRSVLCNIVCKNCAQCNAHTRTDLTVLWIGFCLTGPISLCLDSFLYMYYCMHM